MPSKKNFNFVRKVLSNATRQSEFDVLIEMNPTKAPHVFLRRVRLFVITVLHEERNSRDINKKNITVEFTRVDLGLDRLFNRLEYESYSDETGKLKELVVWKSINGYPFIQCFGIYDCQGMDTTKIKTLLDLSDSMVDRFRRYKEIIDFETRELAHAVQINVVPSGLIHGSAHELDMVNQSKRFIKDAQYRFDTKTRTFKLCAEALHESIKKELVKTLNEF